MKDFRRDLVAMQGRLQRHEPFTFSRFGDGEIGILTDHPRHCPEFQYNRTDPGYGFLRERLLDSFRYQSTSYYVGISCPACVGMETFLHSKEMSCQAEPQLTWSTLFVNSNYLFYMKHVVPLFLTYPVFLVCHRSAALKELPFPVKRHICIDRNAWRVNFNLAHQITEFIGRKNIEGALFLLCAGPFANILAHALHAQSQKNTYLDVGSTLDPFLFGSAGLTRRYLRGEARFLQHTCSWK